jgi:hypothetical protein
MFARLHTMRKEKAYLSIFSFVALFWVTSSPLLLGQEPYAIPINRSNGLPSISVYQCYQDSEGFIWLASDVGITRYDGFHFQTFKNEAQTAFSGSCIYEDDLGRIWYQNFDGYNYYYDPNTTQLHPLTQKSSIGYMQYGVTSKHFFHISNEGIEVFDLKNLDPIKTIKIPIKVPQHTAFNKSNFYLIESDNIYQITENLAVKKAQVPFDKLSTKLLFNLNEDSLVLVQKYNEENKLFFLSKDLTILSQIRIPEIKLIHTINFINGQIWISTPNGTYVFSKSGILLNHYFKELSISGVVKDRQNNYWFTTTNQGIFIVPNLQNKFLFGKNKLPNKIAKISDKQFLISTKKGELFIVNREFDIIQTLVNAPEKGEIYFLNFDERNQLVSYTSNGFHQINLNGNLIFSSAFAVKDIIRLDQKYWAYASSNSSGYLINGKAQNVKSYWDDAKSINTFHGISEIFTNNRARSVAFDSLNKKLYFATNVGLYEVVKKSKREILKNGKSFYASKLLFYNQKLYALSTKGSLYSMDNQGAFELMNLKYDIDEYDIKYCALFDHKLVFASSSFIHQLDLNTNQHAIYNVNVSSYDNNDILVQGDELFLLINEGIIKSSIQNNSAEYIRPIFKILSITSKDSTFSELENPKLNYHYDEVKIHYAILDFGNTRPLDLFFRINNEPWQITSKNTRELNFPSLKPGKYTIEFKLGNEVLKEKIEFSIVGPWWKSSWFVILGALLILALIITVYKARLNHLANKNRLLEENVKLEQNLRKTVMTAVKSQMNPHFFYNALNTIQAFIYTNDKENAGKYLLKFSQLTRQVLEMSEKETVGLDEEIQTIKLYLDIEKARFDEDFNYSIDCSELQSLDSIKVPPMLIQPYIENALKHGLLHKNGQKILQISFTENKDYLIVSIDDNGIGRKRSTELNKKRENGHKSFAGEANKRRLEVLNHGRERKLLIKYIDKQDEYGQAIGTEVILSIPMKMI